MQCNVDQCLIKVNTASQNTTLPINIEKCKVLHYGKVHPKNYISVLSNSSIKDLGITFQVTLTFDEPISKITSAANSRLGIIRNTFHIIDKEGFLILYKSNMRPILEYGISVWSSHLRKHDKEIEQIQQRSTRLIKGFDHYSYPERLQELNLLTLYYRRCKCVLIQVF